MLPDPTPLPAGKDTLGLDPSVDPPVPATGTLPDHRHPGPPSEEYPSGSPFWELVPSDSWSDNLVSPVREGYNEVRFDSLVPPPEAEKMYYVVNLSQLLGLQFHIPTVKGGPIDYGFCISNLAFFRD